MAQDCREREWQGAHEGQQPQGVRIRVYIAMPGAGQGLGGLGRLGLLHASLLSSGTRLGQLEFLGHLWRSAESSCPQWRGGGLGL
jgi:hypothetical protein